VRTLREGGLLLLAMLPVGGNVGSAAVPPQLPPASPESIPSASYTTRPAVRPGPRGIEHLARCFFFFFFSFFEAPRARQSDPAGRLAGRRMSKRRDARPTWPSDTKTRSSGSRRSIRSSPLVLHAQLQVG